jgi:hypothetical protein
MPGIHDQESSLTRRQVLTGADGAAVLGVAAPISVRSAGRPDRRRAGSGSDGTPEQVHLTWGADPATSVTVSWASPGQAANARVPRKPGTRRPARPAPPPPDYTEFETFTLVRPRPRS